MRESSLLENRESYGLSARAQHYCTGHLPHGANYSKGFWHMTKIMHAASSEAKMPTGTLREFCQEEMKSKKQVDLMADMGNYLSKIPVFKQCWMLVHACRYCCGVKRKKVYADNDALSEKKQVAAIEQGSSAFERDEGL